MPSDIYNWLLKGYKTTGTVWALVDLVRSIPVLLFPVLHFQRPRTTLVDRLVSQVLWRSAGQTAVGTQSLN